MIINDRADVALVAGADGVHVGQDDLDVGLVRKMLGPEKIVGTSVKTVSEAYEAIQKGATYLGAGML